MVDRNAVIGPDSTGLVEQKRQRPLRWMLPARPCRQSETVAGAHETPPDIPVNFSRHSHKYGNGGNNGRIRRNMPRPGFAMFAVSSRTMNPEFNARLAIRQDRALRQQVESERFRMLLAMATPTNFLATLFAVVGAYFFQTHVAETALEAWVISKVVVSAARLGHMAWHRQAGYPYTKWWQCSAMGLLILDGALWGIAAAVILLDKEVLTSLSVLVTLIGITSVATFTLHPNWRFNAAFCLPMLVPATLTLYARHDTTGYFGAIGLTLFAVSLMAVAWRAQKHICEMLTLRFYTARVAQDRESALAESERRHEIKRQFVATMSHELRTPMHGVLGLTRMLQAAPLDAVNQNRLSLVEKSGQHLLAIINDILDFSRIEAGRLPIEPQAFDLAELVIEVAELTSVTARDKGLTLRTVIDLPYPCLLMGDPARIRQILVNLIGNAIKFTDTGRITVRVARQLAPDDSATHLYVLQVEDTGIGMTPENSAHIFEPFHQIDNALDKRFGGTGLGLTITRELCHAMHGDISCHSEPGRGSIFEVILPLPPATLDATASGPLARKAAPGAPGTRPPATGEALLRGHVLLAEDNEVNAMVVEALLTRLGLTVEVLGDGQAVVDRVCADRHRPDLILMDCQMPSLDGFEATKHIRWHERIKGLPRLPVVALTASALAEDSARCLAAGMDAHLPKPFHDDQLLAVLQAYLQQPTQAEAA